VTHTIVINTACNCFSIVLDNLHIFLLFLCYVLRYFSMPQYLTKVKLLLTVVKLLSSSKTTVEFYCSFCISFRSHWSEKGQGPASFVSP